MGSARQPRRARRVADGGTVMCMRIMTRASGEICLAIVLTVSVNRTATKQVPDPRHPAEKDLEERRLWFARSLHLWQQDRGQRQAVVIAENHDPPETLKPNQTYAKHFPNLELVAFQHTTQVEQDECGEPTEYMGEHELIALNMARRRAKRVQNATHVVMVSGRYYIPSLVDVLAERLKTSHDIITMATDGLGGGCSIMGCRNSVSYHYKKSRDENKTMCDLLWKCPYWNHNCENAMHYRMPRLADYKQRAVLNLPFLFSAHTRSGSGGYYRDTPDMPGTRGDVV